ncbi:TPA: NADPH-dependent 7-cyano-7-deazaguanine reductase QueF, partial [Haemophilus influenzae]
MSKFAKVEHLIGEKMNYQDNSLKSLKLGQKTEYASQ